MRYLVSFLLALLSSLMRSWTECFWVIGCVLVGRRLGLLVGRVCFRLLRDLSAYF